MLSMFAGKKLHRKEGTYVVSFYINQHLKLTRTIWLTHQTYEENWILNRASLKSVNIYVGCTKL